MADFKQGGDLMRDNVMITAVLSSGIGPQTLGELCLKKRTGAAHLRDSGGLLNTASAY